MSIRFKVILPYLLLTLLIAVTGVYVVTNLVTNTLSERLTNQLIESGHVISDDMALQEIAHVKTDRTIIFTSGVLDAINENNVKSLRNLAIPVAISDDVENLLIFNANGEELLHIIQREDGGMAEFTASGAKTTLPIVQTLLRQNNPDAEPQRSLEINPVDGKHYYYTALPMPFEDGIIGVVVVGTSIDSILPTLKNTSLANIILYDESGQVFATTLGAQSEDPFFVASLAITPSFYQQVSLSTDVVEGENLEVDGRGYRLARGPLKVGNTQLGLFAVALPLEFILEPSSDNRNNYIFLFMVAMIVVILVGYGISRLITTPLSSLITTSQAIAQGDLTQRSGLQGKDEIGTLASTFDEMTEHLQLRTIELEKNNQLLEQMDKTKASFIQVSAHELRTPLTLVKGYAQMLDQRFSDDVELSMLSKGILDGYERMATIVNNMLDVSKIDNRTLKVTPGTVQIGLLVMQLEKDFKTALQERNLSLVAEDLGALPLLEADPALMKKAFYHLIINAIKYTPDGGQITVRGRETANLPVPSMLEIVIQDTGIGIAPEHLGLIFGKFYQTGEVALHSSGKTNFKGGGPGLGLSIAQGIIEAHQGKIWVESPGYNEEACPGSSFFVQIPLKWVENENV